MRRSLFILPVLAISLSISACKKKDTAVHSAPAPAPDAPIEEAPKPAKATVSPIIGAKLYVDQDSNAMSQAKALTTTNPEQSQLLHRIADQPAAVWFGGWTADIYRSVDFTIRQAEKTDTVPVVILYNIPHRDCGQYSAGGFEKADEYRRWVRRAHAAAGDRKIAFILEPDALGHLDECLSSEQQEERLSLLRDAVRVLRQGAQSAVYLDSGHSRWQPADVMAARLKLAGIEDAHGFSLNTSNYGSTEDNTQYGQAISALVDDAHFVIDTSRNGAPPPASADDWCNPPGRKLGVIPNTNTGIPKLDAYLWLKKPGESDGDCNGGPKAGEFWLEQALELAR